MVVIRCHYSNSSEDNQRKSGPKWFRSWKGWMAACNPQCHCSQVFASTPGLQLPMSASLPLMSHPMMCRTVTKKIGSEDALMLKPRTLFVASSECSLVALADGTWKDSTLWLAILPAVRLWRCQHQWCPFNCCYLVPPHYSSVLHISLHHIRGSPVKKYWVMWTSLWPARVGQSCCRDRGKFKNTKLRVGQSRHVDLDGMLRGWRWTTRWQTDSCHGFYRTELCQCSTQDITHQKSNLIISRVQHVSLSVYKYGLQCAADLLLHFFASATATDDVDQAKSNERSGNASCCGTLCFRPLHCNAISWWHLSQPKHCQSCQWSNLIPGLWVRTYHFSITPVKCRAHNSHNV